jgi:hypothetical protein
MSRGLRIILVIVGVTALLLAAVALAYAFRQNDVVQVQATLAPTLFVPPQVVP